MTQVRIRHEDDVKSAVLGDVDLNDLDPLIPLLNHWGVTIRGEGSYDTLTAEFVYDPEYNQAYFEVVIHDD